MSKSKTATRESRQRVIDYSALRRKNCENKTFKLAGVMNPTFGEYPDFVIPVFICEEDKRTYIQEGDDDKHTLNSFSDIEDFRVLDNIVWLENMTTNTIKEKLFNIDSKPVFAFAVTEKEYFIGDSYEMKKFLNVYSTQDEVLKEQIADFLKCGDSFIQTVEEKNV